jgi:hypothetical protein
VAIASCFLAPRLQNYVGETNVLPLTNWVLVRQDRNMDEEIKSNNQYLHQLKNLAKKEIPKWRLSKSTT